jgi:hypothetical protein
VRAVSDTSPLSYLVLIRQTDLPPKVFTTDEVRAGAGVQPRPVCDPGVDRASAAGLFRRTPCWIDIERGRVEHDE